MKLHLNLTLRRALMAAMAVVSLQTTQAELTTEPNNLHTYLYGTGELTPDLWNSIWNATPKPSTLTIGNYLGAADATLSSSTYNNGKDIYIGGVGYDSNQEVANDGKLSTITGTVLNVNQINLGNSLVGGKGTLIMDGGTVNVTSSLFVGVNRGCGSIEATNGAAIKVGTSKTGAVFTMSHRKEPSLNDTVTLTGSSITVGAAGGVMDFTSIGHSIGTATLNLEAGSTAHFYDQLLVGEMGGSNGTINVGKKDTDTSKSTLTLASTTVLGYESGAHGTINIYDGTVNVGAKSKDDILVIGHKGSGKVKIKGGTLDAGTGTILLGAELGANPEDAESTPDLHLESGKAIAQNLIIGGAGRSSVKVETDAILEVHDIVIDGTDTSWSLLTLASGAQVGIQGTDGTRRIDNLFIGGDGKNGHLDNNTTLTVGNTIIGRDGMVEIDTSGSLTTDYLLVQSITDPYKGLTIEGKTTVNGAFVTTAGSKVNVLSGGILTTSGGTTPTADGGTQNTIVAGTLTIENGGDWKASGDHALYGTISNSGTADIASATAFSSATITNNAGGTLTIGTLVNSGTITNAGATGNGEEIKPAGTIDVTSSLTNYGPISNGGTWTTAALTNLGTISNTGTWNAKGETTSTVGTIANDDTLNVSSKLTTGTMTGTGTTEITGTGSWIITGQTDQKAIKNSNTIKVQGLGRIDAGTLSGTGTTTILIDGTSLSGQDAVIKLTEVTEDTTSKVNVAIDIADPDALVGKNINFLSVKDKLIVNDEPIVIDKLIAIGHAEQFTLLNAEENDKIDWVNNQIVLDEKTTTTEKDDKTVTTTVKETIDFITAENSTATSTTGIFFSKHDTSTKTDVIIDDLPDNVEVKLEVKTETVVSATEDVSEKKVETVTIETPDNASEQLAAAIEERNEANKEAAALITKADAINQIEIVDEVSTDANGNTKETKKKVVVGKDVEQTGSGSMNVKSVLVNQHTSITQGNTSTTTSATIAQSGLTMVFEGETTHTGTTDTDGKKAELGFNKDTKKGTAKLDNKETDVRKVDIVQLADNAKVTITNTDMHATHALSIGSADSSGKTTLVLEDVDFHVGGETDVNVLHMVEVQKHDKDGNIVYKKDDQGEKILDEFGNPIPETVIVPIETEQHLTTKSTITNAEVTLKGKTTLKFEQIDFGEQIEKDLKDAGLSDAEIKEKVDKLHGEASITGSEIVLNGSESQLGESNYTDKQGTHHKFQEITLVDSQVKGTGKVKNTKMKGGRLSVGSSPGYVELTDFKAEGRTEIEFYMIADTTRWDADGMNNNTDHDTGNISQLIINSAVSLKDLNPDVIITLQVWDPNYVDGQGNAGGYVSIDKNSAAAITLGNYLQDGAEIQFISGNLDELTILGKTPVLSESSLPTLADGLFWDTTTLFVDGIVRVYSEILEEPCRIANTLVSAGETVLNFGRLAEAQAALREAGTTRTWGSAIAMFDSIDSGSSTIGYDYNTWGAAVGVDHAFTKNTVVGVAFGCTWGENEAKEGNGYFDGGSIDQEARMIGIYGVHKFRIKGLMNDVKLNAFAAYGMFENDSTRTALKTGNKAKAEWDSDAWVLSASLSRDITTDTGVVFTPYVGVEYTTAGMDDFTEQGRKTADYSADEDYSKLSVKVGVGVSKTYGSFTPYANVAFISDVARNAAEVTAVGRDTVTGKSALPGRNGFEIGVGATWQLTENLDVNAGYSAEIRDKATEHNARVGIGYTF